MLNPQVGVHAGRRIAQVLHHWHQRQLPVAELEALVNEHMHIFAEPLGALMAAAREDAPDATLRDAAAVLQRFSPPVFLAITERRLELLASADRKGAGTRA